MKIKKYYAELYETHLGHLVRLNIWRRKTANIVKIQTSLVLVVPCLALLMILLHLTTFDVPTTLVIILTCTPDDFISARPIMHNKSTLQLKNQCAIIKNSKNHNTVQKSGCTLLNKLNKSKFHSMGRSGCCIWTENIQYALEMFFPIPPQAIKKGVFLFLRKLC